MIEPFACRVELSSAGLHDLEASLLEWLADMPDVDGVEMWRRHSYGLLESLSGVFALLLDLMPTAIWSVGADPDAPGRYVAEVAYGLGLQTFKGEAALPSRALLGAVIRTWASRPEMVRAWLRAQALAQSWQPRVTQAYLPHEVVA